MRPTQFKNKKGLKSHDRDLNCRFPCFLFITWSLHVIKHIFFPKHCSFGGLSAVWVDKRFELCNLASTSLPWRPPIETIHVTKNLAFNKGMILNWREYLFWHFVRDDICKGEISVLTPNCWPPMRNCPRPRGHNLLLRRLARHIPHSYWEAIPICWWWSRSTVRELLWP